MGQQAHTNERQRHERHGGRGGGCANNDDDNANEGQRHPAKDGVFVGGRGIFPKIVKHVPSLPAEGPGRAEWVPGVKGVACEK